MLTWSKNMYKLGLKLWSSNKNYISDAQRLYENGVYQYIELFAVPGTFGEYAKIWKSLKIPFVIHAPHFRQGLNFARQECFVANKKLVQEALKFANELEAQQVIFHPGVEGDIKETARQLKLLFDPRMIIENKPYCSEDGKLICNGFTPDDITFLIAETGVGFCLDLAHAICAANALKKEPITFIKAFITLNPHIFHLSDNAWESMYDSHKHLGAGSFKLREIMQLIPPESKITLETPHDYQNSLKDFEEDAVLLRSLIQHNNCQRYSFFKASILDIEDLYHLANDSVVRQNSFHPAEISWDIHVAWFNEKLKDKKCFFYVIRDTLQTLVGQIRFDEIEAKQKNYLISFSLAKNFRGKGLGKYLLAEAIKIISEFTTIEQLVAYIKNDNETSLHCFIKAGFSIIDKENLHDNEVYKLYFNNGDKL